MFAYVERWAFLILCYLAFSPYASAQERLDIEDAVRLALAHNPALQSAAVETGRAHENLAAVKTSRLPQLSVTSLGGQLLTKPAVTFAAGALGRLNDGSLVPSGNTTIEAARQPAALVFAQVNQPLSQLHRIGLEIDAAKTGEELSREQLRLSQQEIANQVRRAYYALVQTESELQSAQETIRLYQDLNRLTLRYVSQETALQSDLLDVKARLAQSEYRLMVLNDSLATQKEQINQLMGRPVDTPFSVDTMLELAEDVPEAKAARQVALDTRPELKQVRLQEKQADLERRAKLAEYIPDVSLNVSYFNVFNAGNGFPGNVTSAGFQVQWEPFDWGRKKHQAAAKAAAAEEARLQARDISAKIQIQVNAALRRMEEARRFVSVCRLSQESAHEALRVQQVKYSQQAALLKDVLQAQTAKASAEDQTQKALADFWSARADLDKAMGAGTGPRP